MNPPNQKNIAILINSRSGKGRAIKLGAWLSDSLSKKGIAFKAFTASWPQHLAEFTEAWIVGGDGTINYFLNQYPESQLPIAIFKGGTGNDLAWNLYGEMNVEDQLELVLNASPKPIDLGICNGRYYANSCGIGFDGEVLRSINTIRWLGGHLGYLAIVIRKIFSFNEFRFSIQSSGQSFNEKFLLVIINNSRRTGGGFMVTPTASLNDGKLNLVLCKPLGLFKRLRYLPVIEKGKHLHLPFIYNHLETEVLIETEDEIFAQLDGELISAKKFVIKVLPGKLMVKY